MKIFGYRFTKEEPTLEAQEILELNKRIKEEQAKRTKDRADAAIAKAAEKVRTDKIKAEQERAHKVLMAEQASRKAYARRTRAKSALVNLEQVERYTIMKERTGVTPQRKASLDAIVVARIEEIKGLGFNYKGTGKLRKELERIANGN